MGKRMRREKSSTGTRSPVRSTHRVVCASAQARNRELRCPRLEAPAVQAATQYTERCRLPGRIRGRTKLAENLRRSSIRYALFGVAPRVAKRCWIRVGLTLSGLRVIAVFNPFVQASSTRARTIIHFASDNNLITSAI